MKDKFSYFDFLAYFTPGVVLIWAGMVALKNVGLFSDLKTENVITDSLVFIVLGFVVGHFIQFRSKEKTEAAIKQKDWNNAFVSEQFLVKGNQFCLEPQRQRYIELLQEHFGLKPENAQVLETPENTAAKEVSHGMYRSCFTFVTDKKLGEKAITANVYYSFFRGISTACVYSSIIFGVVVVFILAQQVVDKYISGGAFSFAVIYESALVPFLLVLLFGYASRAFRERARQRGELHVSEVFDSMSSYFSK